MGFLELTGVVKSFGATQVVRRFDLSVAEGEFISFLGPSGCGKTTVLRMIAGFEHPSEGTISVGGEDVTPLRPAKRKIGMVFQAYALFRPARSRRSSSLSQNPIQWRNGRVL